MTEFEVGKTYKSRAKGDWLVIYKFRSGDLVAVQDDRLIKVLSDGRSSADVSDFDLQASHPQAALLAEARAAVLARGRDPFYRSSDSMSHTKIMQRLADALEATNP